MEQIFKFGELSFFYNTQHKIQLRGCKLDTDNRVYLIGPNFIFKIIERFFTGQGSYDFLYPIVEYVFLEEKYFKLLIDAIKNTPSGIEFIMECFKEKRNNTRLAKLIEVLNTEEIPKKQAERDFYRHRAGISA